MRKIRWGVLGTAHIAEGQTIPGMQNTKNCALYAIAGRSLEKAKEFLKLPVYTIKEVGIMVGYGDSNYFTRIFKKKTGMTPIEYRNQVFFQPET